METAYSLALSNFEWEAIQGSLLRRTVVKNMRKLVSFLG